MCCGLYIHTANQLVRGIRLETYRGNPNNIAYCEKQRGWNITHRCVFSTNNTIVHAIKMCLQQKLYSTSNASLSYFFHITR